MSWLPQPRTVPGPILASLWTTPFSFSRVEKSRNPKYLQRAVYVLLGLGSSLKMGVQVAFCPVHNKGYLMPPHRLSPPQKCPLCFPANREMPLEYHSCSHLNRNMSCPPALISSPIGNLYSSAPQNHPSCPWHTHTYSAPLSHTAKALGSAQQGGQHRAGTLWSSTELHGRELSRDKQYLVPAHRTRYWGQTPRGHV